MFEQDKCGCGRDVRYSTQEGQGSCNKYGRCPSYEDLIFQNKELTKRLNNCVKAAHTVLAYKDSSEQYITAENEIHRISNIINKVF